MTNAKQVMDFRASKGFTTAQSDEHQRKWTERKWEQATTAGNYDSLIVSNEISSN